MRRCVSVLMGVVVALLLAAAAVPVSALADDGGPAITTAIGRPDLARIRGIESPSLRQQLLDNITTEIEISRGTPDNPGRTLRRIYLIDAETGTNLTLDPALLGWYKPPYVYLGSGVYQSEDSITWTGKNAFGNRLWTLTYTMQWEWNGSTIVGGRRWSTPNVYALGWKWNGIITGWNSGGKGYTYWRNGQQGHFSFVDYNGFALQNVYPWNEMTSYKDGSIKWAQG